MSELKKESGSEMRLDIPKKELQFVIRLGNKLITEKGLSKDALMEKTRIEKRDIFHANNLEKKGMMKIKKEKYLVFGRFTAAGKKLYRDNKRVFS